MEDVLQKKKDTRNRKQRDSEDEAAHKESLNRLYEKVRMKGRMRNLRNPIKLSNTRLRLQKEVECTEHDEDKKQNNLVKDCSTISDNSKQPIQTETLSQDSATASNCKEPTDTKAFSEPFDSITANPVQGNSKESTDSEAFSELLFDSFATAINFKETAKTNASSEVSDCATTAVNSKKAETLAGVKRKLTQAEISANITRHNQLLLGNIAKLQLKRILASSTFAKRNLPLPTKFENQNQAKISSEISKPEIKPQKIEHAPLKTTWEELTKMMNTVAAPKKTIQETEAPYSSITAENSTLTSECNLTTFPKLLEMTSSSSTCCTDESCHWSETLRLRHKQWYGYDLEEELKHKILACRNDRIHRPLFSHHHHRINPIDLRSIEMPVHGRNRRFFEKESSIRYLRHRAHARRLGLPLPSNMFENAFAEVRFWMSNKISTINSATTRLKKKVSGWFKPKERKRPKKSPISTPEEQAEQLVYNVRTGQWDTPRNRSWLDLPRVPDKN